MVDLTQLQALVAGAGQSGIRNLHFRDYDHRNSEDLQVFASGPILEALRAGDYRNVILENDHIDQQTRRQYDDQGLHVYADEVRHQAIERDIRHAFGGRVADFYQQNRGVFLDLVYNFNTGSGTNEQQVRDYLTQHYADASPAQIHDVAQTFFRVAPIVCRDAADASLNARTIANIRRDTRHSDHNNVFFYGAFHTETPDRNNTRADMDAPRNFPGYNVAVFEDQAAMDACQSLRAPNVDQPEFIFLRDSGRLIDQRDAAEQRRLPLERLWATGASALHIPAPNVTVPEVTRETPAQTDGVFPDLGLGDRTNQPGATDAATGTSTAASSRGGMNISMFGIAGAFIGGMLAGNMGQGLFKFIFMAIGAIGGFFLGSRFDHHDAPQAPATPSTTINLGRSPVLEGPAQQIALSSPSIDRALAFANVSSVVRGSITDAGDPASPIFTPVPSAAFLPAALRQ